MKSHVVLNKEAIAEHTNLFCRFMSVLLTLTPGACITKLITAVIYGFRNKLECLSLNTRPGWKRSPGTNTLAYYGNRKLRP
jgi:hypothetical protein